MRCGPSRRQEMLQVRLIFFFHLRFSFIGVFMIFFFFFLSFFLFFFSFFFFFLFLFLSSSSDGTCLLGYGGSPVRACGSPANSSLDQNGGIFFPINGSCFRSKIPLSSVSVVLQLNTLSIACVSSFTVGQSPHNRRL